MADEEVSVQITAIDRASEVFRGLSKGSDDLMQSISSILTPAKLLGGFIGYELVNALGNAVRSFEDFALEVRNFQYVAGGTTEQVNALLNGLGMMGVGATDAERMITMMSRAAESGSTALGTLKLSVLDASGSMKLPISLFLETIDKLGAMTDATTRDSIARQLWGKTWLEMVPVIQMGSDALIQLGASSSRVMTKEDTDRAEEYHRAMAALGVELSTIGVNIGRDLVPPLILIAQVGGPLVVSTGKAILGVFQEVDAVITGAVSTLVAFTVPFAWVTDAIHLTSGAYQAWSGAAGTGATMMADLASKGVSNLGALGSSLDGLNQKSQTTAAGIMATAGGGAAPDWITKQQNALADQINAYYDAYLSAFSSLESKMDAEVSKIDSQREKALNEVNEKYKNIEIYSASDISQLRININAAANAKIEAARLDLATKISAHGKMVFDAVMKMEDDNARFVELTEQQKADAVAEGTQQRILSESKAYQFVHDAMNNQTDEFEWSYTHRSDVVRVTQQGILESYKPYFDQIAGLYGDDSAAYIAELERKKQNLQQQLLDGTITEQTYYTVVGQLQEKSNAQWNTYMNARLTAAGIEVNQNLAREAGYYDKVEQIRQTNLKNQATVYLAEAEQDNSLWAGMLSGATIAYAGLGTFWGNVSKGFETTFQNVQKGLSDSFFDVMTGQFDKLGDAAKNFGLEMIRTFSDILANAATRELLGLLLGTGNGSVGGNLLGLGVTAAGAAAAGGGGGGGALSTVSSGASLLGAGNSLWSLLTGGGGGGAITYQAGGALADAIDVSTAAASDLGLPSAIGAGEGLGAAAGGGAIGESGVLAGGLAAAAPYALAAIPLAFALLPQLLFPDKSDQQFAAQGSQAAQWLKAHPDVLAGFQADPYSLSNWSGPLASGIYNPVESFLTALGYENSLGDASKATSDYYQALYARYGESALYASGMLVNPPDLTAPVELSGGRAAGGPVWPGWSGMVGEQGPERLTIGKGGFGLVTPNDGTPASGGGGGDLHLTVNIEVNGSLADANQLYQLVRNKLIPEIARIARTFTRSSSLSGGRSLFETGS